jgi:hypothetical protein
VWTAYPLVCSAGDHEENKGKGHGAHYWCTTCHAKKVVQAEAHFRGTTTLEAIVVAQEPGSVLKNSNANQRAIANSVRQRRTVGSRTTAYMAVASESVPLSLPGIIPGSIVPESVPPSLQETVPDSIVVNGEQVSYLVAVGIEKNKVVLAKEAAVSSRKRKKNALAGISNQIQTAKNRSKWRNTKKNK